MTDTNTSGADVLAKMHVGAVFLRSRGLTSKADDLEKARTAVAALIKREAALVARNAELEELFSHLPLSDELMSLYADAQSAERGEWAVHLPEEVRMQLHEAGYKGRIVAVACGKKLAALAAEVKALREDAKRLDWFDQNGFTAYRQIDPIDGISGHCVVVHETQKPRRGNVADGIRFAIDAARASAATGGPQ